MIKVLSGDDDYAVSAALKSLIDLHAKQWGDLTIERFDGEEAGAEQIIDAISIIPLFAERKLVVVSRAAKQKDLLDKVAEKPEIVPETTELVLVGPRFDKRAGYYKKLRKLEGFSDYSSADTKDIASWIEAKTKEAGGTISRADAAYLSGRVGQNKTQLSSEIEKLVTYNNAVTRQSIDLLSEPLPQSTVFQLLDAVFSGNSSRAIELYEDQRKQKIEPLAILGMVAWQLHNLALVRMAGNRSPQEIAKEAKLNPFVVGKNMTIASKLSELELRKLVRRALELDVKLKSTAVDADEAMRYFILSVSRAI